MITLHEIYGLPPPPPMKNSGYAYVSVCVRCSYREKKGQKKKAKSMGFVVFSMNWVIVFAMKLT